MEKHIPKDLEKCVGYSKDMTWAGTCLFVVCYIPLVQASVFIDRQHFPFRSLSLFVYSRVRMCHHTNELQSAFNDAGRIQATPMRFSVPFPYTSRSGYQNRFFLRCGVRPFVGWSWKTSGVFLGCRQWWHDESNSARLVWRNANDLEDQGNSVEIGLVARAR